MANPPPSMTYRESDLIKLTAQYIATYGRSFLVELVGRQQSNVTFDFLKPQHGHFKYLTNLIMQYSLVRNYPLDILEQLKSDSTDFNHVFNKMTERSKQVSKLEDERRKKEEEIERDKLNYSLIDWHDFSIVETIDFAPSNKGTYPPPTTADQVGNRYLMQERFEEATVPQEMDIDDE